MLVFGVGGRGGGGAGLCVSVRGVPSFASVTPRPFPLLAHHHHHHHPRTLRDAVASGGADFLRYKFQVVHYRRERKREEWELDNYPKGVGTAHIPP
jgi:hypothetical protein